MHVIDKCSQDWFSVASILEDVLREIKKTTPMISEAFLRSDNAGCYHCAQLILAIPGVSERSGVSIRRYDFSDPQAGKDVCDRKIAPMKTRMKRFINEGHDIVCAADMKTALESYGGVRGSYVTEDKQTSMYHMSILSGLHRLQKKALRIISNSSSKAHHIPLCYSLEILDLEDLYSTKALSFLYDYIHGNLPSTFQDKLHLYFSRNNELLIKIKYRRTDTASRLLYNTLPNIWNHLESNIKTEITKSKKTFITKIKLYYLNKYENFKCSVFNCYSCSHTT